MLDLSTAPRRVFLNPCVIFAHRQEHVVTTVLGSCVSVCLWDPQQEQGGINHFMLPLWNGDGLPTPKYGNIAIEKLLEKMLKLGSHREHLVAKVFGGASVLGHGLGKLDIGTRNIDIAESVLARERIRILSSDLGGLEGRRLHFNTRTGRVQVHWISTPASAAKP